MNWLTNKKLLVPFDFGEESRQAVDTALEMTSAANIHVIHVAPDLAVASPEIVWDTHTDEVREKNIQQSFQKGFAEDKYRGISFRVSFGDPGHGVASYANEIAADLIVMPSHGRTGLKHLLIGSVAERVVRMAHCPVLVLRN